MFAAPGACSRVTMTALKHIGLPFEYYIVRLMKQQHKEAEFTSADHPNFSRFAERMEQFKAVQKMLAREALAEQQLLGEEEAA